MGNDDRSSLDELEAKLRKARAAHEPADSSRDGRAGMASATRQIGVAYRIFVELLAGILVGAGLASLIAIGLVARPIGRLTQTMQGLAGGDTSVEVPAADSRDEIGDMARAVVVFRENAIRAIEAETGVPMVLNTSFNENEPVVCRPEEALDCFLRTRMDRLVLGDWIVSRGA